MSAETLQQQVDAAAAASDSGAGGGEQQQGGVKVDPITALQDGIGTCLAVEQGPSYDLSLSSIVFLCC